MPDIAERVGEVEDKVIRLESAQASNRETMIKFDKAIDRLNEIMFGSIDKPGLLTELAELRIIKRVVYTLVGLVTAQVFIEVVNLLMHR